MNTKFAIIGFLVCIFGLFYVASSSASRGYGYAGYGGYHRGPSFFYLGPSRYNTYRTSSGGLRRQSGNFRGGSARGGK